jgi:hypothetical protein
MALSMARSDMKHLLVRKVKVSCTLIPEIGDYVASGCVVNQCTFRRNSKEVFRETVFGGSQADPWLLLSRVAWKGQKIYESKQEITLLNSKDWWRAECELLWDELGKVLVIFTYSSARLMYAAETPIAWVRCPGQFWRWIPWMGVDLRPWHATQTLPRQRSPPYSSPLTHKQVGLVN